MYGTQHMHSSALKLLFSFSILPPSWGERNMSLLPTTVANKKKKKKKQEGPQLNRTGAFKQHYQTAEVEKLSAAEMEVK